MNTIFKSLLFPVSILAVAPTAPAGSPIGYPDRLPSHGRHCGIGAKPNGHAPIGVMGDHTHAAGEFMLSYRFMTMRMDGHRAGTDSLSSEQVFHKGFDRAATEMDMDMHMFGLMFAPTDSLTLFAMGNYQENDMTLSSRPAKASHGGGHRGGTAHGASGGHGGHSGGKHSHSSSGWGDVTVGGLYQFYNTGRSRAHIGLGVSIPTGEDLERDSNTNAVLPYGMQLGSGTWDLKPSLTYTGDLTRGGLAHGAQVGGTIRLEDENDAGYQLGDIFEASYWLAQNVTSWASLSARVKYTNQDSIDGHYNVPHPHAAPPHFTANYGGETVEVGVGINLLAPSSAGFLSGHRLAVEALFPVHQDANGVGMERDWSVTVGWQKSF